MFYQIVLECTDEGPISVAQMGLKKIQLGIHPFTHSCIYPMNKKKKKKEETQGHQSMLYITLS